MTLNNHEVLLKLRANTHTALNIIKEMFKENIHVRAKNIQ